jgi:thiomorpholine-carboxylate dehydrogenase
MLNGVTVDKGSRPVVFKSVGIAIEDIAAAKVVYERLTGGPI